MKKKRSGSEGKQRKAETAAREKGSAKSELFISLTRFKRTRTFRIQATSR
jgi:hypothetical protein